MAQSIEPWLLDILVCPQSKTPLVLADGSLYSTQPGARRRYTIEDGIPNLLIEESQAVSEEEFERAIEIQKRSSQEAQTPLSAHPLPLPRAGQG
jgi:uncharacterized protein YbaR (Trm112 family)